MNIGAFFDIDGTLLPGPSLERRFLGYLRWRGEIGVTNWARWLAHFVWPAMAGDPLAAVDGNKTYLAGVPCSTMETWTQWMRHYPFTPYYEASARLKWHAAQGHRIFLVSGTLRSLAEAFAEKLPVHAQVCATELQVDAGHGTTRWTGRIAGKAIAGPAKARAIEQLAAVWNVDLTRSFAYGDRYADRWMLERAGHPVAVNASARLARLAQQCGWATVAWGGAQSKDKKQIRHRALRQTVQGTGTEECKPYLVPVQVNRSVEKQKCAS